ncbi:MAG: AAA family ATPase [Nitrospira sp.]|nr:AAA family ATPase [Nitrospira sp.]
MRSTRYPLTELRLQDFPFPDALVPQYLFAWAAETATRARSTALEPIHLLTALQALHCVDPERADLVNLTGDLKLGGRGWPPFAALMAPRLPRAPRVWDPSRLPLCRALARLQPRLAPDTARLTARDILTWAVLARTGRAPVWTESLPPSIPIPQGLDAGPEPPALVLLKAAARIEAQVRAHVLGQGAAAEAIAAAYTRAMLAPTRTAPVILTFMGPPGTGKTLAARALAEGLSQLDPKAPFPLLEYSMTQYQEWASSPRLLDPGIGLVARGLTKEPASVVLFDEIEKAHPSILADLLPFLAGDLLPGNDGPRAITREAWFVFTTNLGVEHLASGGLLESFAEDPFEVLRAARPRRKAWDPDEAPALPPEFVSRIAQGQAVVFRRPAAHHLLTLAERTPLR